MKFKKTLSFIIFCALTMVFNSVNGQSLDNYNTEVPKDIIIIRSNKDYNTALTVAKQAASRLNKKLDLRQLKPNKEFGLTMSKVDCAEFGYPCYLARGDGNAFNDSYISIEYSDAYKGFSKGYYIVVAAITNVKSASMKTQLSQINKVYPDAYAKRTYIWFGCMH
jgi:hypothetical protein